MKRKRYHIPFWTTPKRVQITIYDPLDMRCIASMDMPYRAHMALRREYSAMAQRMILAAKRYGNIGLRRPRVKVALLPSGTGRRTKQEPQP